MKLGKFTFKSFKEFQTLSNLAIAEGIETDEELNKFFEKHCSKN